MIIYVEPNGECKIGSVNAEDAAKIPALIEELKAAGLNVIKVGEVESHRHEGTQVEAGGVRSDG